MQNRSLIYIILSSILFSLTGTACQSDEEVTTEDHNILTQQLQKVLISASQGQGLDYFLLPDSDVLEKIPQDKHNPLNKAKIELGKLLYHETGLAVKSKLSGGRYTYSCASCHHAKAGFQAGIQQGIGEGGMGFGTSGEGRTKSPEYLADSIDVQLIRTPSTLNSAYQTNQLWNGQFGGTGVNIGTESSWTQNTPKAVNHLGYEGVESQAIAGLSVHRLGCDTSLILHTRYKSLFDQAFGEFPQEERYTILQEGLAIAAYERTLLSNEAPFQRFLRGETSALSEHQKKGALLFFGKAGCVSCHTGPALNSMEFYALGMEDLTGSQIYQNNPKDAIHLGRGGFTGRTEDNYKFKVPQLYNLKDSPFYGHGASFTSVYEVIQYKNQAIAANPKVPLTQLAPEFQTLSLNEEEVQQIADFIENALYDPKLERYQPEKLPSALCFPNNDEQTKIDVHFTP